MIRRDFLKISATAVGLAASTGMTGILEASRRRTTLTQTLDTLARARMRRVAALREYVRAGKFPKNPDYLGQVPYFVDYENVPCAVAYLMIQDGHQRDVSTIAKANNHVRVMDAFDGPLVDWLLTSGITQEEAARIQPSYEFMNPDADKQRIRRHLNVVLDELDANTLASLETAVARLKPTIASELPGVTSGLLVLSVEAQREKSLINLTSHSIDVSVTPLDKEGRPRMSATTRETLPSRGEYFLGNDHPVTVDWVCSQHVASGAIRTIDSVITIW